MDDDTKPTEAQADESIAVADSAAMLAAVSAERDALADQLLRLRAEFENFRKRAERERGEFTEFATMEAVRAVVPVLDDFERALKMESADKEYARGMELIYQRLLETLKKLGLEAIETEGQKFDPALHHAVEMEKTGRVEDHTILYQHQRGYSFKGKLLRPAIVKVAVEP
ncbi:MAG: nucleotide exchange factor GrpE [Bryobacteraceae bacterium]|jgi:molecular chaperone GrpE